jgi:hypothetical protein
VGTENQTWLIIAALPAETKFPMIGWFGYGGRCFRQDSVFQPAAKRLRRATVRVSHIRRYATFGLNIVLAQENIL